MGDTATILGFYSYEQHTNNDVIAFSKPFFNDIYIMESEYASATARPPFYGDTMTLNTWNSLKIPMGKISDSEPIYTLQPGYKYIYNHSDKTFDIYDDTGTIVKHRTGITCIGDLHIDFTIYSSHAFVIMLKSSSELNSFLITAKLAKKTYGESPIISSIEEHDKLYGDYWNNINNSDALKNKISMVDDDKYDYGNLPIHRDVSKLEKPNSVGEFYINNNIHQESKIYDDTFDVFTAHFNKPTYRATFTKYSLLLAMMSRCMSPELNGVERYGETHNNRPVYEPWLIWGVFKFLFLHREEDGDDGMEIEVFDLSPNWSY